MRHEGSAMQTYSISPRSEATFEPFTIRAESLEIAAAKAGRKVWGSHVGVERVSGTRGKSGVFQCYVTIGRQSSSLQYTSIGGNFHVIVL